MRKFMENAKQSPPEHYLVVTGKLRPRWPEWTCKTTHGFLSSPATNSYSWLRPKSSSNSLSFSAKATYGILTYTYTFSSSGSKSISHSNSLKISPKVPPSIFGQNRTWQRKMENLQTTFMTNSHTHTHEIHHQKKSKMVQIPHYKPSATSKRKTPKQGTLTSPINAQVGSFPLPLILIGSSLPFSL